MIRLEELAEKVGGRLLGKGDTPITGVAPITEAKKGQISFVLRQEYQQYIAQTKASAVIVGENVPLSDRKDLGFVVVSKPDLAYAVVAGLFSKKHQKGTGKTSGLAFVDKDARISRRASIAPYAYISRGATIGPAVIIDAFVYIGEDVKIGAGTRIFPNVSIYDGVKIGKNVVIHSGAVIGSDGFGYVWDGNRHVKIPQLGSVEIEDDVEIGANVTIDRASLGTTRIGKGTKIDNLVQVAHNVTIGENSIIVAQVGIAGSATIGKNVVLAGQAGVRDHVIIGDNVKAGGQTGITKDVPPNSLIMGTPHQPFKEWAKLQGYLKMLPLLFTRMKKVEKELHLEGGND